MLPTVVPRRTFAPFILYMSVNSPPSAFLRVLLYGAADTRPAAEGGKKDTDLG